MLALVAVFCMGVVNFAAHKAVLESGHPLLARMAWLMQPLGGKASLLVEYAMLLAAMAMVNGGSVGWAWLYALYTASNVVGAWLIAGGRA